MARHTDFGKKAEELAEQWLIGKGYTILHRNWRSGRYEIDIIARLNDTCHFIEVKAASSRTYGHPEERVSKKKISHLMTGAAAWLRQSPGQRRLQYDVLSVTILGDTKPEYFLIEDIYL
jgi:putative endonuclease